MVIATPESTLSLVGNARIVGCSLYHVRPHCSWTPRLRITAHLCAFNQSGEKKKMTSYVRLSSSMVTMGVPLLWQKWLLRASGNHPHWPQESRIRLCRTPEVSALQEKLPIVCSSSCAAPEKPRADQQTISEQSSLWVRKGWVDLPVEDASSVTANIMC